MRNQVSYVEDKSLCKLTVKIGGNRMEEKIVHSLICEEEEL